MQEPVIKQEVASMDLAEGGGVDPDPHRPDSTLVGGTGPSPDPPPSPLLAPESKPRPNDAHVFAEEKSAFGSPEQDRQNDGLLDALPLQPEQPEPPNEETQQQLQRDAPVEQKESVQLVALGSEICSDHEEHSEEHQTQDVGSFQFGADHELVLSQPLHPPLQWQQPSTSEEEDQLQPPPFKIAKASRGKEKLLEEDDFPLLDRGEPSGQNASLSNPEQFTFPCDMQIPTLVDISLPAGNEFEYSHTLQGLRNEFAFRQIQHPAGINHIGCFSDLMPTADVVAAEQQAPAPGLCGAVQTECHSLRTEGPQIVKAEDRRVNVPLGESGDGTWRTDSFVAQQLAMQGLAPQALHNSNLQYAPVMITLPKTLEELQSFEGRAVVPPFRLFNSSPGAVQPPNPFRLLSTSPDAGTAAECAAFETFGVPQFSNEAVHTQAHAQRTVLPTPSLSGLHAHLPDAASVGASTDRFFIAKGDGCISPGDARGGVCFNTNGAENPQPAPLRPHGRVSFPEGPYAFMPQPSTIHGPNVNMASPHMHYEPLNGSGSGSGSGSGPRFLETPAVAESKMKTEILKHPMFPEMLAAHVACLRVTVPENHMLGLPEQLTRSQDLLNAYSAVAPQHLQGEENDPQHMDQMNKFMKGHIDALWNLQARLDHCVPQVVREAMLFISKVENETKGLYACANQVPDASELFEPNVNEVGNDEAALHAHGYSRNEEFGPPVPSASERSIMERIREQLKTELTEEGYRKKIMEVRDEILRKRRAGKLPTGTTSILKDWWSAHVSWPYPTEDDKERLMDETGLELKQINNWFINQRKRNWNNGATSSKANDRKNKRS